ncbi:MAG: 2-hydroxyacid dehydrogenase [Dehalococcoidia bacterium]
MKNKVYVTNSAAVHAIANLREHFDVEVWEEFGSPPRDVLLEKSKIFDGMMIESDCRFDEELFKSSGNLKVVGTRAVGYDNIDVESATRHGVAIGNTPGILHESCADFTFALILSLARKISYSNRKIINGDWKIFNQLPYLGSDVHGKTLGLIGLGTIGAAVAKRAQGFDMNVIYSSRTRKPHYEKEYSIEWIPDMGDLLSRSDYVSIHVALTEDTKNLIGFDQISKMKESSFLINTSRGGTLDQDALTKALEENIIAGAALDVTVPEPIDPNHPLVHMDNVVMTPHIASASSETYTNMSLMAADNIISFFQGTNMPSCLNPEVLK